MTQYNDLFSSRLDKNYLQYDSNRTITTNTTYPHSKKYRYESSIEFIDFNKECEKDIAEGNGFIIEFVGKDIKKELNNENGIFSPKFGQTLADVNPFIDRYRCGCHGDEGLRGRLHHGLKCPKCGKICTFVDDNFSYFGWIKLVEPYVIIHPAFYKKIESFFGKGTIVKRHQRSKLTNILDVSIFRTLSKKGKSTTLKDEPYAGIGMMEFYKNFDEIMQYYLKKKPNKKDYYDDIYDNIEKVFTNCIPVFSTLLRPIERSDNKSMSYEKTNAIYRMIGQHAMSINQNNNKIQRDSYRKNQRLFRLQEKFKELYNELEEILSGKKGDFRCLLGGRYNFSSRCVIVQNPNLRIDEITLPVIGLTVLLEQRIKNILCRMYNMTPTEAHAIWYNACIEPNKKINAIIQSIIDDCKSRGMPGLCILINRNPTIAYGGILQMFCVGFTETYTMAIPLQVLKCLAADFDGDALNILLPINQTFMRLVWEKFNPRNAMYISRNDGYFNPDVSMQRDTLINANTLASCGREYYTKEEIAHLSHLLELKSEI